MMISATAPPPLLPPIGGGDDGSSGGSDSPLTRTDPDRWYFPKERLDTTPSRKSGVDADKELTYRQQSANFIQDIGQRLQVNQLCINTAIVYMHRFYMFHSFTQFHRNAISAASIFLAAKVEEQPRKLEHVIKVAHYCLHRDHQPQMDSKSEQYLEQSAELVMNENILLQTLGFDVAIDHPHTHVVKCCQLVRASKDLAQTSYFMATNSLHLTTMCLQYKPTVVACVCIHLACKWSSWEIPRSKEGKDWFWYVDDTVTTELLEKLTTDFLQIFNKSPSRLKKKINSLNNAASALSLTSGPYHGFDSSPSQHHSRSRSPSPKRQGAQKSSSSQQPGVPGKPRPHLMPMSHHPMKVPYPPGAPGSNANKHSSSSSSSSSSHGTSHPPHAHPSSHSSSGKPPHPGMPMSKDPHHPHHSHPKNPYPAHGHVPHGQYPHGGSRPNMQSSSSSSQPHHGHGMHSKPPLPGSTNPSSHPSYPSSNSIKGMPPHNPSKPSHMPPSGAPKIPNPMPGAVKNPNPAMFHSSSQSHNMKKPYDGRPEFGMAKRDGVNPANVHHSQNHQRPPHDKMMSKDGRHHSSAPGMPPLHGPGERSSSHHNMPYLGQDQDRSNSSSNPKMPYMDNSSSEANRHRNMQIPDGKRSMPHGASTATNGNNNDTLGSSGGSSGSGTGDSHVPSKPTFRPPSSTSSSTMGHNSQQDSGASKFHSDGFGDFGNSSTILSIEDRRKRRHAEMSMGSSGSVSNNKRPRPDNYSSSSAPIPALSTNSLFSPEELSDSAKRLPPTSQFSPSAVDGPTQSYNNKVPDRSSLNSYGNSVSEGIVFGSSSTAADIKPDIRRMNPAVEFQTPDLLQPINDVAVKSESLPVTNNIRTASLFSPEFTPGSSAPSSISPAPAALDGHKRDVLVVPKVEVEQQPSFGYANSGQISFSPQKEGKDDDSHSKKSKKNKKEKHKHKHKEEKKHKKDKHKDKDREKEKEKEKKDKHRSKDKHSSSTFSTPETGSDVSSHKIKIKIGDGKSSSSVQPSISRHSSSKSNSSSSTTNSTPSVTSLKVKISNKERVSSVDEDFKYDTSVIKPASPSDESTPCCPGFGPCLTCNKESKDQYRFISPFDGLTMKLGKNKEASKPSKESSSSSTSRDSKKSKDKSSKSGSSSGSALHGNSLPPPNFSSNARSSLSSSGGGGGSHHLHKNGMEKSSKKKEKSVM